MILVDTSVWIDHLRIDNALLARLLNSGRVLTPQREVVLAALSDLPRAKAATDPEVLTFIDRQNLFGRGIGYVDVHLLAAIRLTAGAELWTRDNRLRHVAEELGVSMKPERFSLEDAAAAPPVAVARGPRSAREGRDERRPARRASRAP